MHLVRTYLMTHLFINGDFKLSVILAFLIADEA